MKISIGTARALLKLSHGEKLANSSARYRLIDELVSEEIILRSGRRQKTLRLINPKGLKLFLQNKYNIYDLEDYIAVQEKETVDRSELTRVSADSKLRQVRTFQGFLVNSYQEIKAELNGKMIKINPPKGSFRFIYDFESFIPDPKVTVVGIENPENFRYIEKQAYLFKDLHPLFVSRYPQTQSKDLIRWLKKSRLPYLHFGDFDPAGIGIYLHEFKKHLSEKAGFFVPQNIDSLLARYGNRSRYDRQKINFDPERISENELRDLLQLIHKHKKGLDQELLIG